MEVVVVVRKRCRRPGVVDARRDMRLAGLPCSQLLRVRTLLGIQD